MQFWVRPIWVVFSATWTKTLLTVIGVGIKKLCSLPTRHGLLGTSCLPSEPVLSLRIKAMTSVYLLMANADRFPEHMQTPNAMIQGLGLHGGEGLCKHLWLNLLEWPQWWDSKLSIHSCSSGQASHPQKNICNSLAGCFTALPKASHRVPQWTTWFCMEFLWIIHSFTYVFLLQSNHTIWTCFSFKGFALAVLFPAF